MASRIDRDGNREGADRETGDATARDSADVLVTLELRNDVSELERIGETVAAAGAEHGWPPAAVHDVELALDEIVTNIISYAYDDGGDHTIAIRIRPVAGALSIEVEDDGVPFDPTTAPGAVTGGAIEERPIGGLGWHLVRSVVDGIDYRREGGRNVVTLLKRTGNAAKSS